MVSVHRIGISLERKRKELSAHTIASFLVAQGVENVPALRANRLMSLPALRFINDRSAINYWLRMELMDIPDHAPDKLVLTQAGLRECVEREAGTATDSLGRKKKECVTPELVREMRNAILFGEYHNPAVSFEAKDFNLG